MKKSEFIKQAMKIGATKEEAKFLEKYFGKSENKVTLEDNRKLEELFENSNLTNEQSEKLLNLGWPYEFIKEKPFKKFLFIWVIPSIFYYPAVLLFNMGKEDDLATFGLLVLFLATFNIGRIIQEIAMDELE
ncbi:hypothetical protein PY093_11110 [Cytobacillus sp. S13-E01]|uniref:hypothetical protein n=1 Tax=Cytobacillus sp. S13-E01 TaxID=3031326 RepID=UPI0023D8266C|nr:hypothetical protein [Cytobacillus sp. S13-E01]MDF0727247.1 hypothetical protein [Cytobacillus sp. S13-E01]